MKGAGIHVYFDKECIKIIERMEKGELSKVCKKSILAWDISSEDILILEEQEEVLVKERNKIEVKIAAIDKKLDRIAAIDNKKEKEDRERKKELEEQKETIKEEFMEKTKKLYNKSEPWFGYAFDMYWVKRLKGEEPKLNEFLVCLIREEQELRREI